MQELRPSTIRKINKLIGSKVEKWTVLGIAPKKAKEPRIYVKCECGFETSIRLNTLGKRSKGCSNCCFTKGKNHHSWLGYGDISSQIFRSYLHHAKSINVEFKITIEEVWNLYLQQNKKCALTGWNIHFAENRTASLDRIDSNKGYTIDNIQWIHRDINLIKSNIDPNYFIKICRAIAKHTKNIQLPDKIEMSKSKYFFMVGN